MATRVACPCIRALWRAWPTCGTGRAKCSGGRTGTPTSGRRGRRHLRRDGSRKLSRRLPAGRDRRLHAARLRHTWATWHYAANRDLDGAKKLGGWNSVAMVLRYAHVNVGELKHTIDRLPGGKPGGPRLAPGRPLAGWGKTGGQRPDRGRNIIRPVKRIALVATPLVRERSRVQSSLAAPLNQTLSGNTSD